MKLTEKQKRELASLIGEGTHTGLRKAIDSRESVVAWDAINNLPDGEWGIVSRFTADGIASWLADIAPK